MVNTQPANTPIYTLPQLVNTLAVGEGWTIVGHQPSPRDADWQRFVELIHPDDNLPGQFNMANATGLVGVQRHAVLARPLPVVEEAKGKVS